MADDYGIGTGIGVGLSKVGQALEGYADRKVSARDKQADEFEKQASDIASNIAQMGGASAPGAAPYVQQLYGVVQRHNALFPAHETPALIQRISRFVGKPPGAPRQDRRASMTPETMIAAAQRTPPGRAGQVDLQTEIAQIYQARRQAFPQEPDDEARQKAFELAMGIRQGGTGTASWHLYVSADGKTPPRLVNQNNPEEVQQATSDGLEPQVPGRSAGGAGVKYGTRGPDKRLTTVTVDGQTVARSDLDNPSANVPDRAREIFAQDDASVAEFQKGAHEEELRRERVRVANQVRAAQIAEQRQDQAIVRFIKENDVRSAQSALNVTKKAYDDVAFVKKLADDSDKFKNVQYDRLFLQQVQALGRRGSINRNSLDDIIESGTPGVRLENLIDRVAGGQALNDETRRNIINFVLTEYNGRLENYNNDRDAYDSAKANALPTPPQKGTPQTLSPSDQELLNRANQRKK